MTKKELDAKKNFQENLKLNKELVATRESILKLMYIENDILDKLVNNQKNQPIPYEQKKPYIDALERALLDGKNNVQQLTSYLETAHKTFKLLEPIAYD